MARSSAGTRQPKPAVEVDVAGAADSLESQLVLDTHGQTASAPGVSQEPTPSSESPLRVGDVCEVVGGDKHAGDRGMLVAMVDKMEDLGEDYAFFKLSSGQRAVLPLSTLQRCNEQLDGASADPSASKVQLSAADILISTQGLPGSGGMLHEPRPRLEPTASPPADLMTAVQRKRARKRGRGERRSKDAPVHSVAPLSC
jgi:hypothetical protein